MNFSDILDGVGSVLDAPRAALYKGGDAVARGLGYRGRQINRFSDILGEAGMDEDSLLTKGLGMAGDIATDPLTWAGGMAGGKLFKALGPMHGGDAAKLAGLAVPEGEAAKGGVSMIQRALEGPNAKNILNEIPKGSTFQGAGAESLALKTPQGDVLRLSPFDRKSAIGYDRAAGEANLPTRRVVHGNVEVQRVPLAENVGDRSLFDAHSKDLSEGLQKKGFDVYDLKPEDVGTVGGKPKILDLGSIDALDPSAMPFSPVAGRTPGRFRALGASAGAAGSSLGRYLGE